MAAALAKWAAAAHCVDCVVGCDGVRGVVGSGTCCAIGGVVGSGTCCAILLLGSLHLALQTLLGSWRLAQFVGFRALAKYRWLA